MIDHLNIDILEYLLEFMPRKYRKTITLVNKSFNEARYLLEKHEFIRMWNDENNSLKKPLNEPVVSEEELKKKEEELKIIIPFHLKLFVTVLSNGRSSWSTSVIHVSNLLGPVSSWKLDSQNGYVVLGVDSNYTNMLTLGRDGKIRVNRDAVSFYNFVTMVNRPLKPEYYNFTKFKERQYFPFSMTKGYYSILPTEYLLIDKLSIHCIEVEPKCFSYAPEHIKRIKSVAKSVFLRNTSLGSMIPKDLLEDPSFVLDIFKKVPVILRYASPKGEWWNDRDFAVKALNYEVSLIRKFSEEIRNDREIIDMILEKNVISAFPYIGKFQEDLDIVKTALTKSQFSIVSYIKPDLLINNRDLVLMILSNNGRAINNMPPIIKGDRECFFLAAKTPYFTNSLKSTFYKLQESDREDFKSILKYSPQLLNETIFKNDRELFLEAVTYDGGCLRFASNEFKADKELVLAAVKNKGSSLTYASLKLRDCEEVVLEAVKNDRKAISKASKRLSSDQKIIRARRKK